MKFILWIVAIAVGTYWFTKVPAHESAKLEVAHARLISVGNPSAVPDRNSAEDDARKTAQASRQKGLPRKVSEEFTLLSIDAVGSQVIALYEFNSPAVIPITNQLLAETRSEIIQNFRSSASCTNSGAKALLQRGMSLVQNYRLYRSNNIILTVTLGYSQC